MSRWNNLTIQAFGTSTTPIVDPKRDLLKAEELQFRTQYPGGLYANASFYVPRQIVDWWELQGATRISIKNDSRQVYEGYVSNFGHELQSEDSQGVTVRTAGGWGKIMMNWPIAKRWADDRITEDAWVVQTLIGTTVIETEEWGIERLDRIHINPNAGAFVNGEFIALRYTMPTGETVKRIKYSYDFLEKTGQSWEMSVWRSTDGTTFTQMGTAETYTVGSTTVITGGTSAALDVTLATPSRYVDLRYYAKANNNPVNDDHNHATWTALKVYSELGDINMEEIHKDVIGLVTDLNTETRFISAAASELDLMPFLADGFNSAAEVLSQAYNQGDGAYNRWAAYLIGSERAYVPDGKPLLVLGRYPATTDYEYAVSLADLDKNLLAPFTISEDFDPIVNWVVVQYVDIAGRVQYRSPSDNADLTDATSVAAYGRRGRVISVTGQTNITTVDAIGKRYLATFKNPQFRLTSPITVYQYIRGKGGMIYSASEIRSRDRLRIEDFANTVIGGSQGLTFVVTQTLYDNDSETCQLSVGVPEAPLLPRESRFLSGGGPQQPPIGIPVERTITDAMLRKMKLSRVQWNKMTPAQRQKALKKAGY